jgi:hypothetical protein
MLRLQHTSWGESLPDAVAANLLAKQTWHSYRNLLQNHVALRFKIRKGISAFKNGQDRDLKRVSTLRVASPI